MKKTANARPRLDWSRLLGFDQLAQPRLDAKPLSKSVLLAKVGNGKTGSKDGFVKRPQFSAD